MSLTPNTTSTFVELEESTTKRLADNQLPTYQPPPNRKQKRNFKINTKCGTLEMTIERILSFIVMLISVLSLVILAITTFYAYFLLNRNSSYVYHSTGRATLLANRLSNYLHVLLSTNVTINDHWLLKINSTFDNFDVNILTSAYYIEQLHHPIFIEGNKKQIPIEYIIVKNSYYHLYNSLAINKTKDFQYYNERFVLEIDNLLKRYLNDTPYISSDDSDEREVVYMTATSIIGAVLCVFTLLLIIPTSFIAIFGRDNKLVKKLQKANANEVLNFISDPYLNSSFRDYCKQHQQLKYFLLLEKSILFTEYCNEIFNLNSVDNYETNSTDQKIDEFESKKCEIVFEVKTEFLNSKGEYFLGEKQIGGKKLIRRVLQEFKSHSMNLPDDLFTVIESNISVHLIPTLRLFKSNRKTKPIIIQ